MTQSIPWFSGPRYAAPMGSFVSVMGFLPKPTTAFFWRPRPQRPESARPLEEWREKSVVVLLGEAGIGKSFELRRWFEATTSAGGLADYIDLQTESSDRLAERWCRRDVITSWLAGAGDLDLFLDGVDEFPAGSRMLTASLNSFIDEIDSSRLRLRIASRPGAWSERIDKVIEPVAGDEAIAVLSLLPLEEDDAREAAERMGVSEPAQFLEWVHARQAESLASRPLTLRMLCEDLAAGQQPPTSRAELFERYLHRLFRGHQEDARDRVLTAPQRLEVASRIAAATLFSHRPLIVDFDRSESAELGVELQDLVGDHEGTGPSRVEVTRSILQETVETGPFVRFAPGAFVWSSRSYEEYLGARYLARHAPNPAALDAVLVNTTDPQHRTVPALRGAIAWLADLKPEFWPDLAVRDPRALIDADPASRSSDDRRLLIDAWLQGIAAGDFEEYGFALTDRLGFLTHEGISDQISSWLTSARDQPEVIRAALRLAKLTRASGCSSQLIACVEQQSPNDPERVAARLALSALREFMRLGLLPAEDRARVIELCLRVPAFDRSLDPRDDLLGDALDILWPEHLPTPRLLTLLRASRRRSYYGSYWSFVVNRFSEEVEDAYLADAIRAAAHQTSKRGDSTSRFPYADKALKKLVERTSAQLDNPKILREVLAVVFDQYLAFRCPEDLRESLAARASRVDFIRTVISVSDPDRRGLSWSAHNLRVKLGVDLHVALESAWGGLAEATEREDREQFAKAVATWTSWADEAHVVRLLSEGARYPELAPCLEELRKWGDEPATIVMAVRRNRDEEQRKWSPPEPAPVESAPDLEQRVHEAIVAAQDGSAQAFLELLHELYRRPTARSLEEVEWELPIWKFHGWQSVGDEPRGRIVDAARAFLTTNKPHAHKWLGKQTGEEVENAYMGVTAVRLLHSRNLLASLDDDLLARWAPAVVAHDFLFRDAEEAFEEILALLMARVPQTVANTWVAEFEGEAGILPYHAFQKGWCPEVRDAFVAAMDRQPEPKRLGQLVVRLLHENVEAADAFALKGLALLDAAPGTREREQGRYLAFALLHSGAASAAKVLDLLQNKPDEARNVLLLLDQNIDMDEPLAIHWSVDVVGRFAELLATHFPPPDPEYDGVHFLRPADRIRAQRDKCLTILRDLARTAGWMAVDELGRLERAFPAWKLIKYRRMEAVELAGVASWAPPPPAEVLRIIREGRPAAHVDEALLSLERFFIESFSPTDLRMLVRQLTRGEFLEAQLVGPLASLAQLANSVREVLWREGRVDRELFLAILEERPERADKLRAIAQMLDMGVSKSEGAGSA